MKAQEEVLSGFRTSAQQRHLWALSPAVSGPYRAKVAVTIDGELDRAALLAALSAVVEHHEILRTGLCCLPGMTVPVQVIADPARQEMEPVDLTALAPGEQERELDALWERLSTRPLDVGGGRPLLASLVALDVARHVLLLGLPAFCADAVTLEALVTEIAREYGAVPATAPALGDDEPMQYADFAEWQHEITEAEETQEARQLWRRKRLPVAVSSHLPWESAPAADAAFAPAVVCRRLDGISPADLDALAERSGCTRLDVFLASFAVLLGRLLDQPEILLGAGLPGRRYPEIERAPGLFAQYLPVAGSPRPEMRFSELLAELAGEVQRADESQDCFRWSELLGYDPEVEPFLPFVCELRETGVEIGAGAVRFAARREHVCTDRFRLRLCAVLAAGGWTAELHYDAACLATADVARFAEELEALLAEVLRDPEARLDALSGIGPEERRLLLEDFARTAAPLPTARSIHELIEAQAALRPAAPAIGFAGEQLTYGDLDSRANQLAHHLRSLGVGPEVRVGLFLERSFELMIAIVGVLKAGGAYLPIDPATPTERLQMILDDAAAPLVLISESLKGRLPRSSRRSLSLDAEWPEVAARSTSAPTVWTAPDNAAYLIYTSGSTGRPKGVVVSHRNLLHSTAARALVYPEPVERFLLTSSVAFDSSVAGIFWTLCYGGELVLPAEGLQLDPDGLAALIGGRRPSHHLCLPTLYSSLLESERIAQLVSVGTVIVAGEACPAELVRRHRRLRPEARLYNEYGPTEGTVWSTVSDLVAERIEPMVPIGSAIPNTRAYVLDRELRPVLTGAPGDLYMAGAGLARGYLGRPELTALRWLPDPWSRAGGERLYATGDRVRYRPDGSLEFLGRADHQVKIRGFRIELEEVEAALLEHPAVREAVVAAVAASEDEAGGKRLVGYLVLRPGQAPTVTQLRTFLEQSLPEYMLPALFVSLDKLPVGATGKVDRGALPHPEQGKLLSGRGFIAPRTPEELTLAAVWGEVLHLSRVGLEDNFFELGGDSIRSVQVVAKVRARGMEMTVQDLFQYRTIAALGARLTGGTAEPTWESAPFSLVTAEDRARLPEDAEDAYPLAMLQAGMLFHMELEPESAVYHDTSTYHLRGRLDVLALTAALGQVIERHPILRTSLHLAGWSEPLQIVHRQVAVPFTVEDLGHLSPDAAARWIDAWLAVEKRRPFEWSRPPLLRVHVHRRPDETFQFTVSHPHAILDGWSAAVFLAELFELYLASLEERAPRIAPPPETTYRDFIVRERAALASRTARTYWTDKLEAGTATRLDRWPRRAAAPGEREGVRFFAVPIPIELSHRLWGLAHAAGVPLKSVLLVAHLKVLSALAGRRDVQTGLVENGRPETSDTDQLLGLFLNTLPLRLTLSGGSWLDLLRQTFDAQREMLPFRWFPMAELQRLTGGRQLYETAFNYTHFHVLEGLVDVSGVDLLEAEVTGETNLPFFAEFGVGLAAQEINLHLEHDTRELGSEQVSLFAGYYLAALTALAGEPEAPHDAFVPLSAAERQQLSREWNDTRAAHAGELRFHRLFAAQAERTPEALAVLGPAAGLTYAELDRQSDLLAGLLRGHGVGPDVLVGVALERSPVLMIALLAVAKAGGAFVPLDPDYPDERLRFMLEDSRAALLLAEPEVSGRLTVAVPILSPAELLALAPADRPTALAVQTPVQMPVETPVDGLAYVVYTSGSTGRSKGAMASHRSLGNTYLAWEDAYRLRSHPTRHLQMASASFDVFVGDLTRALCSGGALVICPRETLLDPERLYELMRRAKVDSAEFVPAVLRVLAAYLEERGERLDFMRLLVAGSDVWYGEEYTRFLALGGPETRVINSYGVAEASIDSTFFEARAGDVASPGVVPIGRPFAGSRLYLLDVFGQPAPRGVAAELYLGGEGLARGYLGNPDLTAARFLPDPWGVEPGARMYRTGDLAAYRPEGTVAFLGRADDQIKVRGFRIEPGEIEVALAAHPEVRQAVVLAPEIAPGERQLVAYVVPAEGLNPTPAGLRRFLAERLPAHFVPATFTLLTAFPLSPNGKVDRRALASRERSTEEAAAFLPPRTPIEGVVAGIWSDVLGVARVGTDSQFFELGGHSLLATQVISRLRTAFKIELPLRALFTSPTVAGLAGEVETALAAGGGRTVPPLVSVARTGRLPLSFAQQRLWFIDQLEPGSPLYNVPLALRVSGRLAVEALARSLSEVERRHEALRTVFPAEEGIPTQVIRPAAELALPVIDLSRLAGREDQAIAIAHQLEQRPFDLARGPLWRSALVRLGAEEHLVAVSMHHIISDGWSTVVLVRELAALYQAFAADPAGLPSVLPELPAQYVDFAVWQRSWLAGEVLAAELSYWRDQLAGLPPLLELPLDRPRPARQSFRGAVRSLRLPRGVTAELWQLSRHEGATPFMVLLAGFNALLARYARVADVSVGSPIAGRRFEELEGLIGFFVNTQVLRTDLAGDPTFAELVARVREVALAAHAHQDLPFEKLVLELAPERSLSHSPLFQVMFVLQNVPQQRLELPGLVMSSVDSAVTTAKFDLTLTVEESGGEVAGWLEYNSDLFDPLSIDRLGGHLAELLASAATDPGQRVSGLPLLGERERLQIEGWNSTANPFAPAGSASGVECVQQLVERQVARDPAAIAVVEGEEEVTYRELNALANRLAHELRRRGVGPDVPVGICVQASSAAMVIAVLAVLKAGGTYVPLDPAYPSERLAFMLEDAHVPLLLVSRETAGRLPASAAQVIALDRGWQDAIPEQDDDPVRLTVADHLAYLIYTSGSTGRPKGIALPHRALVNLVQWYLTEIPPGLTTLQFASLSFDVSFAEMFTCWASGGKLALISEELRRDVGGLARELSRAGIERAILPVPLLHQLAELYVGGGVPLPPLRDLTTTGEQLQVSGAMVELLERLPARRLHNHYGPAETHVVTAYTLEGEPRRWPVYPPIGRPIANTRIELLDEIGQRVPVGVTGELHIGGVCLARGYFGRPDLTAERFVPDTVGRAPGARLYRTGDLARYLADGTIEYLGRTDHQLKIRGFRVEPGEVEAALMQFPGVEKAFVMAREDGPGGGQSTRRLVAYLVTADAPGVGSLRGFLGERLPHFMIPSAFVVLDALPLTPNRKVDRRALPDPGSSRPELERPFAAPRSAAERLVASIWSQVLGVERIGADDDFFDLGGHSLLATQVVARLGRIVSVTLPVRVLFEQPTVSRLTAATAALAGGRELLDEIAAVYLDVLTLSDDEVRERLVETRG